MSKFAGGKLGSRRFSEKVHINGLPWKIEAQIRKKTEGTDEKCLGFFLWCEALERGSLNRVFSATFRIESEKSEAKNSIETFCDYAINLSFWWGFENFITFAELFDPSNGFYNREEDKVTLSIDLIVKKEKLYKIIVDECKSSGTIEMEIENLSKFAREVIVSERKSETVHIKGFPWKIWTQIEKKNDNEKWLGIYLLCDAPEEDKHWSCKCMGAFRIVSQKSGVSDFRREFDDYVFDNNENSWGVKNFISFVELMDPFKGLYNKSEDKATFAIDVTVKIFNSFK